MTTLVSPSQLPSIFVFQVAYYHVIYLSYPLQCPRLTGQRVLRSVGYTNTR